MSAMIKRRLFLFFLSLTALSLSLPARQAAPPRSSAKSAAASPSDKIRPHGLSDSDLVELTQRQTFRYFWDFAHPTSGLARERSNIAYNYGNEVVTTGGTGF